jgi:hypothetical protein
MAAFAKSWRGSSSKIGKSAFGGKPKKICSRVGKSVSGRGA